MIHMLLVYVAWVNSIIAGSDIINSVLIAIKPNNVLIYRGFYNGGKYDTISTSRNKGIRVD